MKVLILAGAVPPPYGGQSKRVLLHSRELIKRGLDVHLLVDYPKVEEDTLGASVPLHYERKSQKTNDISWIISSFIAKPGIFYLALHELYKNGFRDYKRAIYAASYAVRLTEIINALHPDIVNAHYAFFRGFIAAWLCNLLGIPLILTSYGEMVFWQDFPDGEVLGPRWDGIFKATARRSKTIIVPSRHCAKGPALYAKCSDISVVYSGIDVEQYDSMMSISKKEALRRLGLDGRRLVLFVGGRLNWRKGPMEVAKAASIIASACPEAMVVIVGSGEDVIADIRKETSSITNNVMFTGSLPEEKLSLMLRAADLLLFPSLTDRECMGMSMKEAMLLETPVVGYSVGGTPEAVIDGLCGFLVEPGDVKGLAEKTLLLLENDNLATFLGRAARSRTLELFDSRVTGGQLANIFEASIKN